MRGMIWFREDLRIADNTALHHAAKNCSDGIVAVYFIDESFWKKHDIAYCRIAFILRGLRWLQQDLHALNIPLLCFKVTNTPEITDKLVELANHHQLSALFFNRQYEVNESRRDQVIEEKLRAKGINCRSYDDQVILAPGSVKTQQNSYFRIFTPFKRAWLDRVIATGGIHILPKLKPQGIMAIKSTAIPSSVLNVDHSLQAKLWSAGEQAATQRLNTFIAHFLFLYQEQRDFPALRGTSQLSPYLTAGMISPRHCFLAALHKNKEQLTEGNIGALTWMSELIWREFYKHLLFAFPRLSMNQPFLLKTNALPWNDNEELLKAWQQGRTGFPIIDAAMRQLNMLGWMHNRLRMIVAMFLARNLLIDWRLGERYFMQQLIDGDLAANNGGWQSCAATGADVAPYFRVFNPIRQSERFDGDGVFIRQYCPELQGFDSKTIHDPWHRAPALAKKCNYPQPIVDLEKSKQRFIASFKKL